MLKIARPPQGPEPSERDDPKDVIHAVADLVAIVEPRLLELWRSAGITFAQRRLLRRLRGGSRLAGALAAELDVAAPTVTRQLQRLEDRGLVTRTMDPDDRRRVVVALTAAGERSLADHRIFAGPLATAARELDVERRRQLVASLAELLRIAKAQGAGPADD